MRNKTYNEMYDLLTEKLKSENAILYRQIEECRNTLRTLMTRDYENHNGDNSKESN